MNQSKGALANVVFLPMPNGLPGHLVPSLHPEHGPCMLHVEKSTPQEVQAVCSRSGAQPMRLDRMHSDVLWQFEDGHLVVRQRKQAGELYDSYLFALLESAPAAARKAFAGLKTSPSVLKRAASAHTAPAMT